MECYVTSYAGAQNATKTAMTQQKLNSCLKSLHDLVDTFEPLETVQQYGELNIEDQDYYQGYNKQFDAPDKETPILAQVGNSLLYIGLLDSKGVFTCTRPIDSTQTVERFIFGDVATSQYISPSHRGGPYDPPPDIDNYKPHNTDLITGYTPIDETVEDSNGGVVHTTGTLTDHTATIYAEVTLAVDSYPAPGGGGYGDWYWVAIQQNVTYSTGNVDIKVDLSKYKLNLHRRYKIDVSRITANK